MTVNPSSPRPGWYVDPLGLPGHRWWDGVAWTQHYVPFPAPAAGTNGGAPVSVPPSNPSLPEVSRLGPMSKSPSADLHAPRTPSTALQQSRIRRWYLENFMSIRYWWYVVGGSLVLSFGIAMLLPTAGAIALVVLPLALGTFWLSVQMQCHNCQKRLRTNTFGSVLQCPYCARRTDAGLRQDQAS